MKIKNWLILLIIPVLTACTSDHENFAECILENMPGVSNSFARTAVYRQCMSKHPETMYEIKKGSGLNFFSTFRDEDECIIKNSKKTVSPGAAANINAACICLYQKPSFENEMCAHPASLFDPSTAYPINK